LVLKFQLNFSKLEKLSIFNEKAGLESPVPVDDLKEASIFGIKNMSYLEGMCGQILILRVKSVVLDPMIPWCPQIEN
jgi:hypothetical protein